MNEKKSVPKLHHYVPQFLLRNFAASGGGQICVFDKSSDKQFCPNTHNRFSLILILALLSGCRHLPAKSGRSAATLADKATIGSRDGAAITRQEVLQIAGAYARYEWRATVTNIFHGVDASGLHVDTPDVKWWGRGGWYSDGRINVGVPYCWGDDSTLAEFDKGVSAGRSAGNVEQLFKLIECDPRVSVDRPVGDGLKVLEFDFDHKSVDLRNFARPVASPLSVGVDCSGFVSRCWRLKEKRSTRDLIEVCRPLPGFDDLLPGDAVNKPDVHVILFKEWVDRKHETMRVFEAGDAQAHDGHPEYNLKVNENDYKTTWLSKHGYVPLRYHGIIEP